MDRSRSMLVEFDVDRSRSTLAEFDEDRSRSTLEEFDEDHSSAQDAEIDVDRSRTTLISSGHLTPSLMWSDLGQRSSAQAISRRA